MKRLFKKIFLFVFLILIMLFSFQIISRVYAQGISGGGCFPAGTKVLMSNGTEKNIEDVKIGDSVLSFDGKKQVAEKVLEIQSPVNDHYYTLYFQNNTTLRLTRNHAIYTKEGWKSISPEATAKENPLFIVGKLNLNDMVLTSNGQYVKLVKITYTPGRIQTYNLKKIENTHTYYADNILVHNKPTTTVPSDCSAGGCSTVDSGGSGGGTGQTFYCRNTTSLAIKHYCQNNDLGTMATPGGFDTCDGSNPWTIPNCSFMNDPCRAYGGHGTCGGNTPKFIAGGENYSQQQLFLLQGL